jgi:hypothetical protein
MGSIRPRADRQCPNIGRYDKSGLSSFPHEQWKRGKELLPGREKLNAVCALWVHPDCRFEEKVARRILSKFTVETMLALLTNRFWMLHFNFTLKQINRECH